MKKNSKTYRADEPTADSKAMNLLLYSTVSGKQLSYASVLVHEILAPVRSLGLAGDQTVSAWHGKTDPS